MHQLRAGINAGSKQELARGLPFGANRSQNPAAAEERPPQDRDAAAFRTPGGRGRVGVGWAAAPALRHTGSPRLGRARGRGMPFPGASSLQTCSNPPPPRPPIVAAAPTALPAFLIPQRRHMSLQRTAEQQSPRREEGVRQRLAAAARSASSGERSGPSPARWRPADPRG